MVPFEVCTLLPRGLAENNKGKKVVGFCSIRHLNGIFFLAEPLPLMDLCRRVIRQRISKDRIEQGRIEELNLPTTIKDYLVYRDRRFNHFLLTL